MLHKPPLMQGLSLFLCVLPGASSLMAMQPVMQPAAGRRSRPLAMNMQSDIESLQTRLELLQKKQQLEAQLELLQANAGQPATPSAPIVEALQAKAGQTATPPAPIVEAPPGTASVVDAAPADALRAWLAACAASAGVAARLRAPALVLWGTPHYVRSSAFSSWHSMIARRRRSATNVHRLRHAVLLGALLTASFRLATLSETSPSD